LLPVFTLPPLIRASTGWEPNRAIAITRGGMPVVGEPRGHDLFLVGSRYDERVWTLIWFEVLPAGYRFNIGEGARFGNTLFVGWLIFGSFWPVLVVLRRFEIGAKDEHRLRRGLCPHCGYNLKGTLEEPICPECGHEWWRPRQGSMWTSRTWGVAEELKASQLE
jgi:hypothetical protein